MSDQVQQHENFGSGNSDQQMTSQNLFESAYDFTNNTVKELQKGAQPLCEGIAKRFEEKPLETSLEAAAVVGAGTLAIMAIPAEATAAGVMGAGSVTLTCGVGLYEALQQVERLGKEWTNDGKNPLDWNKLYKNNSNIIERTRTY